MICFLFLATIACATTQQVVSKQVDVYCSKPVKPSMVALHDNFSVEINVQNGAYNLADIIQYSKELEKVIQCYEKSVGGIR